MKNICYLIENPGNLVFKLLHDRGDLKSINFWRTQDKNEVDFINDKKFALEVKFNGDKFSLSGYKQFIKRYSNSHFENCQVKVKAEVKEKSTTLTHTPPAR